MPSKRFQITALAYNKRGQLLSTGVNSYVKTHTLQAKYGRLSGRPAAVFLHAEIAALLKARQPVHRLVVMRYNEQGRPALAKPCPACQLAIKAFNVKVVEHT